MIYSFGDSGAPAYQFGEQGRPVLMGIISRGGDCRNTTVMTISTRVASFPELHKDPSINKTDGAVQVGVNESSLEFEKTYPDRKLVIGLSVGVGVPIAVSVATGFYLYLRKRNSVNQF